MSIKYDVKQSIRAIDKIGESRREAKKTKDTGIHSKKQKENTMSDAQNFARWVKEEYGVNSLGNVNEQHYRAYFEHLKDKGVTTGHMQNVETSLRIIEKGYKALLEKEQGPTIRFEGFCPEKRIVAPKRLENVCNRSYSDVEVAQIREHCSPEVQKAVDLMRGLGLRVREVANICREHFNCDDGEWKLEIKPGKAGGITKGGRFRKVPVPASFVERLNQLTEGKQMHERLINVREETVRKGVHKACERAKIVQNGRGTHGFRHAYARERFNQLATPEQKQMMTRILDNREIGRKADYGIHDKQLFENTKAIIDTVHEELGHGKSRWALAMRYLRE